MCGSIRKFILWLVVFQLFFPLQLLAEGVGKVIDVRGEVALKRASGTAKPQVNDPVFVKDTLRAGEKSRAKLLLVNNTQVSVGSGSSLEITEFLVKDGKESGALSLTSGAVHTKILKALTPEARFEVRTPNAVAGARGTEWLSVVTAGTGAVPPKSDFYTFEEKISVVNPEFPDKGVVVKAGEYTEVVKGFPPTAPVAFSVAAILGVLAELGVSAPGAAGGANSAAGQAGSTEGAGAAAGMGAGTMVGIAAGAALLIGGVIAATGSGGGGAGVGLTTTHRNPNPYPVR
jgi:hypothetical protein